MAVFFTLAVAANFVALWLGKPVQWLYYVPLLPLALLFLTGLCMFAHHYFSRWRGGSRAA